MSMWLTPREAAKFARVSLTLMYGAINRGEIRHSRIPPGRRSIRIAPEAINEWLKGFEQPARMA